MRKRIVEEYLSDGSSVFGIEITDGDDLLLKLDCRTEKDAVCLMMELEQRTIDFEEECMKQSS
ncbi:MAG: hypothetical protein WC438_05725 [Candidatus Pacearchaeota archaeon]|jgi:hypothetical protein